MKKLAVALSLFLASSLQADTCDRAPVSCNTTITEQMDIGAICLDSNTLRYQRFPFTLPSASTVRITMTSPFFPARLSVFDSALREIGSTSSEGGRYDQIALQGQISGGSYTIRTGSEELAQGGTYQLRVECFATPPPPPPPPVPKPTIVMSATPSSASALPDSTISFTINVDTFDIETSVGLRIVSAPPDATAILAAANIPHPGNGATTLTVTVSAAALPGDKHIVLAATGGGLERQRTVVVSVIDNCRTPFILANQSAPRTVVKGQSTTLAIDPSGSAPVDVQWYEGETGSRFKPMPGGKSFTFRTPALQAETKYWVEAKNRCGASRSSTFVVTVVDAPKRKRPVRPQ